MAPVDLAVVASGDAIDRVEAGENQWQDNELIRADLRAIFLELQAANQKLRFENLTLRLQLERRKSRRSFEKKICLIVSLWLLVLLLFIAWAGRIGMQVPS